MAQINIACGRVERMLNGKREQTMVDSAVNAHRKKKIKKRGSEGPPGVSGIEKACFLGLEIKGQLVEGKESQVKVFISRWQKWGILC